MLSNLLCCKQMRTADQNLDIGCSSMIYKNYCTELKTEEVLSSHFLIHETNLLCVSSELVQLKSTGGRKPHEKIKTCPEKVLAWNSKHCELLGTLVYAVGHRVFGNVFIIHKCTKAISKLLTLFFYNTFVWDPSTNVIFSSSF